MISRRALMRGLTAIGLAGPQPALASPALASAYPRFLKFDVTRNGDPLGTVMERYRVVGDELDVNVYIAFQVDLAIITVYRYEHRAREIWRNDRLIGLDSVTHDDGDDQRVRGRALGGRFLVDGPSGVVDAPGEILPSSYWHPRFADQARMLDSQIGKILEFSIDKVADERIVALGRGIEAERFAMRGDIDLDFWYDARRVWQKMAFTIGGDFIEYTRVVPSAGDAILFDTPLVTGAALPLRGAV